MEVWLNMYRLALFALFTIPLLAQNAEISGLISDPSGLSVPNATVNAKNPVTGASRSASSNQQGLYSIPSLPPGSYDITVEATGFKSVHQNGVVLEVDQRATVDFALSIGSTTESITVEGGAPLLNTSDASVSTVISHRFVENMPLNGRSFSSLINLTPGVVLTPTTFFESGQFSVNGQRPDANYFTVDGVSANLGSAAAGIALGQGGAGQVPATSAFGGTSNLVSLDALEEFRIQTSTFAPEYGRTPGAQISVVTKSGTNTFHGTAFEYFRNDKLDANDWFANRNALARPELRQNDFGGVLGGPIQKGTLFFFGSYEGVRVRQPQVANTYVPTLATRQNAAAGVRPILDAFPKPNGQDFGNGTAGFTAGYSDPSTLDSYSIRLDYQPWSRMNIFGRYSDAPSELDQRGVVGNQIAYSGVGNIKYRTWTATLGSNQVLTSRLTNELRFNYSRSRSHSFGTLDDFGGAVPPSRSALYPSSAPENSTFAFFGDFNPHGFQLITGELGEGVQRQINVTDSLSTIWGSHQIKTGVDYRRLSPISNIYPYQMQYVFGSVSNVVTNTVPTAYIVTTAPDVQLAFTNWSLFVQDTWKASARLTITYGVRWEYNAAPSSPNGKLPLTVTGADNPRTMKLAQPGTSLWDPEKHDFAPRLGIAWQPMPNLVLRAGAGIFYDLGYSGVANATRQFPFGQLKTLVNTSFPLSDSEAAPPPYRTTPPVPGMSVVNPNHVLPRTYEWNAAVERTLTRADVITASYIGAAGRKLMRQDIYNALNADFNGQTVIMTNGAASSYHALQAQYRHRFARGLQSLLSYTWSHAIDNVSSDTNFANVPPGTRSSDRGSSDYDIRQTFTGAISYDIPAPGSGVWKSIFGSWSTDSIINVRTAPPVNVVTGANPFAGPLSGANSVQRPDLVSGVPMWISDPNVAGGKRINKAAFSVPTGTVQGNLGRNPLNGFGATQIDLTLRRQFKLYERLSLQARADFFNIFNHPNFGPPTNYMTSPLFGQATQMLGASLGTGGQNGGLNPLYQIGGPRSAQLALKVVF